MEQSQPPQPPACCCWASREVVNDSPAASLACSVMCLLRRPVAVAVARASRQLPDGVARDGVQHSWPAYRDALHALLDDNPRFHSHRESRLILMSRLIRSRHQKLARALGLRPAALLDH